MTQYPTYEVNLPSDGKTIAFRPFLVKEEKVLLMAIQEGSESSMLNAIKLIINSCTFGKVDSNKIPLVDMEYLFLQIRSKSVGEIIESTVTCVKCEKDSDYNIQLDNIQVVKALDIDRNVKISGNRIVTMTYPSMDFIEAAKKETTEVDQTILMLALCMVMITENDKVFDLADYMISDRIAFIENLLKADMNALGLYLTSVPKIAYDDDFTCPHCQHEQHIHIEGLDSFFA